MEFLEPPARASTVSGRVEVPGESDHGDTAKPFRLQFFRGAQCAAICAGRPTGLDQLPRVVALAAANNHDDLYRCDQFLERELSIFRRFTNRIGKPDLCVRMCTRDFRNQRANPIDWSGFCETIP